MRSSRSVRLLCALAVVLGGALLIGSVDKPVFTTHDKAYYADSNLAGFVRPGLAVKVVSAGISPDGVMRARIRLSDPKGLPLDLYGVTTPGAITVRLIAATIPNGQTQYTAYTTRVVTNATTKATAVQPATDTNGAFEKTAEGEYQYTFGARAPAGFDRTATHSIGVQASRDLREFDMGIQYDNDVYNFVPDGSKVTVVRDVVRTETCNKRCHDPLSAHGGGRRKVEMCVLCHQPQNTDVNSGQTVNFPVLIHKIHRGSSLPSVKAGGTYKFGNSDFSGVAFPADIRNCEICHDPSAGAAQAGAWLKPNQAACGACHDDVKFATGEGHLNLPQISDNQCGGCHIPQGDLEFDASVRGAHTIERFSRDLPGTTFEILNVTDGVAGKRPTVTFSLKDKAGNPIPPSAMDRLSLVLAGPTTDYASYVSEDARKADGSPQGVYFWTFQSPIPADAKGTFSICIEGYKNVKLLPGTTKERTVRDVGTNKISYFSVDGSKVLPRRNVVAIEKCNACHDNFSMHGTVRNRIEHCVQCHNVNQNDGAGRPKDKYPPQSIDFSILVHSIHTGESLTRPFAVYGGNGSATDFSDVAFPGDRRNCDKCHAGNSEQLPLPETNSQINNPRGLLTTAGPAAAACTACHTTVSAASHALAMTTSVGESCATCHGPNADFAIDRVHAR